MYPYISPEKIAEFKRRWPDADSFLLHASLEGELRYLEGKQVGVTIPCDNPECKCNTMQNRLMELREWAKLQKKPEAKFTCELCDTEYDTREEREDCLESHVDQIHQEIEEE